MTKLYLTPKGFAEFFDYSFKSESDKVKAKCIENLYEIILQMSDSLEVCESPIEKLLHLSFIRCSLLHTSHPNTKEDPAWFNFTVVPQYIISLGEDITHRADFLLRIWDRKETNNVVEIVIECDGHDFHEKTKSQAKKDRSRDRKLQNMGYYVLRFTGSEIFEDSFQCVMEAISFGKKKIKPK
jgi:hypothetical protein